LGNAEDAYFLADGTSVQLPCTISAAIDVADGEDMGHVRDGHKDNSTSFQSSLKCQFRHIITTMNPSQKPLVWLRSAVKTPPFSAAARIEAGMLLRQLQRGDTITMPLSRPMPSIGKNCHELRIVDSNKTCAWCIASTAWPLWCCMCLPKPRSKHPKV
jgi:hypothetical protein